MRPATILDITDAVLYGHYDTRSIEHGSRYARAGQAVVLHTHGDSIVGKVAGSAPRAYDVEVYFDHDRGAVYLDDARSCPLGGSCKHAVALILCVRSPARPTPGRSWRQALSGVVADNGPPGEREPLALEVSVTTPRPSSCVPAPGPLVRIRPTRRGKNGKWIRTGASWRDIQSPYGNGIQGMSPTHVTNDLADAIGARTESSARWNLRKSRGVEASEGVKGSATDRVTIDVGDMGGQVADDSRGVDDARPFVAGSAVSDELHAPVTAR